MGLWGLWLAILFSFNANAHFEVVGTDILYTEYGLTHTYANLRKDEMLKQTREHGGNFRSALRSALDCFLSNPEHPESPLANAIILAFEILNIPVREPVPDNVMKKAKGILHQHMNLPSTEIRLLFTDEKAENGEGVRENWVFRLRIKTLSDHIHWSVTSRFGSKPTYCYGFN